MLGSTLARLLENDGVRVFAVVRPGSKKLSNIPAHAQITIVECALCDLSLLSEKIAQPCDAFFHFAWADTFGQGRNDMHSQIANIQYTVDAVRAAKALHCKVFVGAGSQAEYGRVEGVLRPDTPCFPENGYGMAKLCAGQMSRAECQALDMRHIWARILSVYGPADNDFTLISSTVSALLRGDSPRLTKGEQLWDFLYCEDAARALYAMAQNGRDGAIYPLGGGNARPLCEYITQLRDIAAPSLPLQFGAVPYAPKQVMHLEADITALTADTGFVPETSFETGINKTVQWIKEQQNEQ